MLHLISSIIVGFIVGLLARFFYPGAVHLSFLYTTLLGIAGSLVGGLIGGVFKKPADGALFHPAGFVLSVICSIGLLYVAHVMGYM